MASLPRVLSCGGMACTEPMKYAIIGDVHSNLEALTEVLRKAKELEVDQFLCIGDLVGYNADPSVCLELVRDLNPVAVTRGNHDQHACAETDLAGFNPQAMKAVQWTREHLTEEERDWLGKLPYRQTVGAKITLVHATLDMPEGWGYIFDRFTASASMGYQVTPVCFFGHTHVPLVFEKGSDVTKGDIHEDIILKPGHKYLINVGSVGQPRDGDPRASFATYDSEERCVRVHRIEYDIAACQAKIREAGLPERLATRLETGH